MFLLDYRDGFHPAGDREGTGSSDNQVFEYQCRQSLNKEFAHSH